MCSIPTSTRRREYLDMGAVDVFSFGPYLIRDGEINPFLAEMTNGLTPQPRCAIGNGGAGALLRRVGGGAHPQCQRRRIGRANGRMDAEGAAAREALNLDGGQTAVMTFMGKQISRIGKYDGGKNQRPRNNRNHRRRPIGLDRSQRQITKRAEPVLASDEGCKTSKSRSRGRFSAVSSPIHLHEQKRACSPSSKAVHARFDSANQKAKTGGGAYLYKSPSTGQADDRRAAVRSSSAPRTGKEATRPSR